MDSQLSSSLLSNSIELTTLVEQLPVGSERSFQLSTSPAFVSRVKSCRKRVLNILQLAVDADHERKMEAMRRRHSSSTSTATIYKPLPPPTLSELTTDDIVDEYDSLIVDVIDGAVERVDTFLSRAPTKKTAAAAATATTTTTTATSSLATIYTSSSLQPPPLPPTPASSRNQQGKDDVRDESSSLSSLVPTTQAPHKSTVYPERTSPIDHSNTSRWFPRIKWKPYALNKDDESYQSSEAPYLDELRACAFAADLLRAPREPKMYRRIEASPSLVYINTVEQLQELVTTLEGVSEFAVDLEHHNFRSFLGMTCLIQISTRQADYIVDALVLRNEVYRLRAPFANTCILKVLHGANMDVHWLQRDFGIYIVNLFDTGQAARVLKLESCALSYLLDYYCKITVDKRFQRADWRWRPLPDELVRYAREDTHYLLYIFDRILNDLKEKSGSDDVDDENSNLIRRVYERSRRVALGVYDKPLLHDASHASVLRKMGSNYTPEQRRAFMAAYAWRDMIARVEDESVGYVLPLKVMTRIASALPRDVPALLASTAPRRDAKSSTKSDDRSRRSSTPPLVTKYAADLVQTIARAIDAPADASLSALCSGFAAAYRPAPAIAVGKNYHGSLVFARDDAITRMRIEMGLAAVMAGAHDDDDDDDDNDDNDDNDEGEEADADELEDLEENEEDGGGDAISGDKKRLKRKKMTKKASPTMDDSIAMGATTASTTISPPPPTTTTTTKPPTATVTMTNDSNDAIMSNFVASFDDDAWLASPTRLLNVHDDVNMVAPKRRKRSVPAIEIDDSTVNDSKETIVVVNEVVVDEVQLNRIRQSVLRSTFGGEEEQKSIVSLYRKQGNFLPDLLPPLLPPTPSSSKTKPSPALPATPSAPSASSPSASIATQYSACFSFQKTGKCTDQACVRLHLDFNGRQYSAQEARRGIPQSLVAFASLASTKPVTPSATASSTTTSSNPRLLEKVDDFLNALSASNDGKALFKRTTSKVAPSLPLTPKQKRDSERPTKRKQ